MGSKVTFDYSKADAFISAHEMESMKKITEAAKAELLGREGAGNDFLGWIDLPVDYDKEEFERKESRCKDPVRFRGAGSNRYRRILSWRKSSNRISWTQLL